MTDLPDSTRALIADLATESARRHGLNAVDLYRRVLARLEQRKARAALPFKRCPVCGRQLPARDYAENATRPDGLQRECRPCRAEWQRDYRRPAEEHS